jgi:ethanolamine utilization microcompartment shell protein EutS
MLQTMLKQQVHFLVVGTTIRYRKEIRPMFGKFQIDTTMCGLDERNLYMMHQFRTVAPSSKSGKKESRIMAQMIVQGVAVQNGRTVINPATFLKDNIGFDTNLIDTIMLSKMNPTATTAANGDENNDSNNIIVELMNRFSALEETMKKATAEDDKKFT